MRYANTIKISVFTKAEEDIESIKNKLIGLTDLDIEKVQVSTTTAEGFENKNIIIMDIQLQKESHTTIFLKHLNKILNPAQKELLLRQKESRLDEHLNFYLRLGKQELLRDDIFITDSGDCYHIRISIAAYPKTRETAMNVVDKMFIQ